MSGYAFAVMGNAVIAEIIDPSIRKKPLILLVDDDMHMVALLRSNLEAEGYTVEFASDGEAGREMAWKIRPNLIISDVCMPGEDGITMMEAIQQRPGMEAVPIILLSGKASENYIAPKEQGVRYALLKKPVFIPDLNELIRSFLT
jgi:CheY-like chemotaxis protein